MTSDTGADDGNADGPETVRVVSPDRPVPLSVQMELQDYDIIHSEQPGGDGPAEVLYLRRRPPDDLLEANGLRTASAERELWRDPNGRLVGIHDGKVLIDGTETNIDPAEAREHVRESDYEPVAVPGEDVGSE